MYPGSILRVARSDGSYGSLQIWVLLRRRQSCVDATLQCRVVSLPRELCGRDVFVCEEHYIERRVSARSLLSHGQRISDAMSSRYELYVYGSTIVVAMSSLRSWLLLSERGNVVRCSSVSCGLFLSSGHDRSDEHHVFGLSRRLFMSHGQQAACGMCGRHLPRRDRPVVLQDLSSRICLCQRYSDACVVSTGQFLSVGHHVRYRALVSEWYLRQSAGSALCG